MLKSAAEAPFTLHTLFQGHPQKNKFVSAKLSYGDMLGTIMLRTVDCFLLSSAFTGCFVGETMRTLQPSDRGHKQCQCLDKQHPKKIKKFFLFLKWKLQNITTHLTIGRIIILSLLHFGIAIKTNGMLTSSLQQNFLKPCNKNFTQHIK